VPLSFIDDINSVRVGKVDPMDEAIEEAKGEYRLRWGSNKDGVDGVHLGVNVYSARHNRFSTERTKRCSTRYHQTPNE